MTDKFSKWAKTQSKFLTIEYGQAVNVEWTGKAILTRGQFGEGWEFDFKTPEGIKTWTCRNTKIISQFDNYSDGEKLVIKRNLKDMKPMWTVMKESEVDLPV